MTFETILLIIICVPTLIIMLLHNFLENKDNKFADFINRIWYEWFQEQWKAIIALAMFLIIGLALGLALN